MHFNIALRNLVKSMASLTKDDNPHPDDVDELSLDAEDLISFSYQVAKGMEYITSKNVRLSNCIQSIYLFVVSCKAIIILSPAFLSFGTSLTCLASLACVCFPFPSLQKKTTKHRLCQCLFVFACVDVCAVYPQGSCCQKHSVDSRQGGEDL